MDISQKDEQLEYVKKVRHIQNTMGWSNQDLHNILHSKFKSVLKSYPTLGKQLELNHKGDMSYIKDYNDYLECHPEVLKKMDEYLVKQAQDDAKRQNEKIMQLQEDARNKNKKMRDERLFALFAICFAIAITGAMIFSMYDPHNIRHMVMGGNDEYKLCARECMKKNSDYRVDKNDDITLDDFRIIRDFKE